MAFDLSTARPVEETEQPKQRGKFNISTARPVEEAAPQQASADTAAPVPQQPSAEPQQSQQPQDTGIASAPLEFMAAFNRGATKLADFLTTDQINAVAQVLGSEFRVPSITEATAAGTQGNFMESGLARDVVRGAGEVVPAAVGGAGLGAGAAQQLPRFTAASEGIMPGVLRQAGQETIPAAAATGAASGAGAKLGGVAGEAVGGEPGRVLGEVVGGVLAPFGLSAAAQMARRPRDVDIPAGEATRFAQEHDLPLMTSDVRPPETFAGKSAAAAAEKIPVTGTGGVRRAQQKARQKTVEDYVETFGEYKPEDVVASLSASKSRIKQAAGRARQQYADQVADVPAVNRAVGAIDDEIRRLTRSPGGEALKTADSATVSKLQDYRDDLLADPTFASLDRLRTTFREGVKGERMTMPTRSKTAIDKIYSSMTDDMDTVIKQELGEESAKKWKRANTVYAQEADQVRRTRLKSVLDKGDLTPETVNNLLYSNKPSEVKTLYKSLSPDGKRTARAGLITKAAEKASRDDEISPDRFLTELNKMSKATDIAFDGADRKFLDGLKSYLGATRRAAQAGVLTPTGQELFQIGAPTAVVTDASMTGGLGTAGAGVYGLMARAYESAPVRKAFQRIAASTPRSGAYYKAISDTSALLSSLSERGPSREEMTE
jgi:hypothetical protein